MDVSVIIPARNEQFLEKTVKDILTKTKLKTEIIVVLDGYWPDWVNEYPGVHYVHFGAPRGMRAALNAGMDIAKGEYVMKLDGHCMVAEGFDKVLAETCADNWVCVPTRHRLDAENWCINNEGRPPINYMYSSMAAGLGGEQWKDKNRNLNLETERVVNAIALQGSCYFMRKSFWNELELLDDTNYGSSGREAQEVAFKAWTSGGACVRVKDTWYAHLHKGKRYGRGYNLSRSEWDKSNRYALNWFTNTAWPKQKISLQRIIDEHFPDMPEYDPALFSGGNDVPR